MGPLNFYSLQHSQISLKSERTHERTLLVRFLPLADFHCKQCSHFSIFSARFSRLGLKIADLFLKIMLTAFQHIAFIKSRFLAYFSQKKLKIFKNFFETVLLLFHDFLRLDVKKMTETFILQENSTKNVANMIKI